MWALCNHCLSIRPYKKERRQFFHLFRGQAPIENPLSAPAGLVQEIWGHVCLGKKLMWPLNLAAESKHADTSLAILLRQHGHQLESELGAFRTCLKERLQRLSGTRSCCRTQVLCDQAGIYCQTRVAATEVWAICCCNFGGSLPRTSVTPSRPGSRSVSRCSATGLSRETSSD